jgi:hypothetical protein
VWGPWFWICLFAKSKKICLEYNAIAAGLEGFKSHEDFVGV